MNELLRTAEEGKAVAWRGLRLSCAVLLCVTLGTACDAPSRPLANADRVDPAWVAGPAAAALDAQGQFALAQPLDGTLAEITYETAREQAAAWLRTFAGFHRARYQEERGEPVNLTRLRPCNRGFYAKRTYEEVDDSVPPPLRRPFGPHWLVGLCEQSGTPVLSLAVSAYNTDVRVIDGQIRLATGFTGGEFLSNGVPLGSAGFPVSPERAVGLLYAATSVRVISVPELHEPGRPQPPILAHWRLQLEGPVRALLVTGDTVETDVLWVGNGGRSEEPRIAVDAGEGFQPVTFSYQPLDTLTGQLGPATSITFVPRPDRRHWVRALSFPAAPEP